jgi:hypothetical protein
MINYNVAFLASALLLTACASQPPHAQSDGVEAIQRNLASPQQCKSSEVRYCSAHGSRGDEGMCMCLKQRDAQTSLEGLN